MLLLLFFPSHYSQNSFYRINAGNPVFSYHFGYPFLLILTIEQNHFWHGGW